VHAKENYDLHRHNISTYIHVFVAVYDLQRGSRFTYIHVFVAVYDLHRRNRSTYMHVFVAVYDLQKRSRFTYIQEHDGKHNPACEKWFKSNTCGIYCNRLIRYKSYL
jgi:serine phosphatase RsbU (regulator of sigma subunit)